MAGGSKGSVAKRKGVDAAKKAIKKLADKVGPLTRQDVTCPICWSILIEPVTPPCGHSFCCTCFNKHITDTSILCPCCRTRLSVWSRTAFKQDNFIDNKLWERVKTEFPRLVQVRLLGEDSQDVLDDDLVSTFQNGNNNNNNGPAGGDEEGDEGDENVEFRPPVARDGEISTGNGELKRELDEMNRKHLEDIENERRIQESDSQKLIKQLQVESGRRSNIEEEQDRILAQQLAEQEKADLNISINARRKLFSQLPESPGSIGIGGSTNNKSSTHKTPTRTSKRPSLSTPEERSTKKQKNGRLTYFQTSSSSSTQSGGSQSQNSILNYMSSSQKSNNSSPLSQSSSVILLDSPKPSTSHSQYSFFKDSAGPSVTVTSSSSSVSAFSSTKSSVNKGIPVQLIIPRSIYNQSVLKPMNRSDDSGISTILNETDTGRQINTPDSIDLEINSHFRPIRTAPRTPPRRLPDGSFLPEPKMIKTTPVKLVPSVLVDIEEENSQRIDIELDSYDYNISCIPLAQLQDPTEAESLVVENDATLTSHNANRSSISSPTGNDPFLLQSGRPSIEEPTTSTLPNEPPLIPKIEHNSQGIDDDIKWMLCDESPTPTDSQASALIDLDLVRAQSEAFELLRQRRVQEEQDRKLAKKLQKEFNTPVLRGEEDNPFSLRNWLNKRQSTATTNGTGESTTATPSSSHTGRRQSRLRYTRRSTNANANTTIVEIDLVNSAPSSQQDD